MKTNQPESLLSDGEKRYRKMIEEVQDYAILLLDKDGTIMNWNKGAENIKGYSEKEIVGKNFRLFYRKEDIEAGLPEQLIEEATLKGKATHEGWRVKKNGETFWGSILITALHDEGNNVIGFSKVTRDLTQAKLTSDRMAQYAAQLEARNTELDERSTALKKSEERYHKMIEEVQEYAILLLDKEGTILNWNKGAEKIKGYTEKEIIGKNFRIFYQEEDRIAGLPEELIKQASVKGKATHEGWRVKKNGEKFWGSIVITALHDKDNNIIGFSKVTRDLTQMKQANDRLQQYATELEAQNKELEQFAFIASHDMQEPLRKIRTFATLLEKNKGNEEEKKEHLEKINSAAARMSALIKDVLTYSRLIKSEKLFTPTDLAKVFKDILEDFELLIAEKQATITFPVLPVINGNPVQLNQLFSNLLSNALKFSDKNPLIDLSFRPLLNGEVSKYPELDMHKKYIHFIFKDNGIGFNPKYAEQVFKLFQRLNQTEKGNGIGLAVCKKVVENHCGHISVISKPGEGTSFHIFLPA